VVPILVDGTCLIAPNLKRSQGLPVGVNASRVAQSTGISTFVVRINKELQKKQGTSESTHIQALESFIMELIRQTVDS